jgi:CheY-like chemotaxis protein
MGGEQILIVDDNPANMKLVTFLLRAKGYDVRTAVDGVELMRVLESFQPALILMDLQLPGTDGLTLTRVLKEDPRTSGIVIVAVTAYAMKGDEAKAFEVGCDGYITKPIDTRKLPAMLSEYLAKAPKSLRPRASVPKEPN